MTYPPQPESEQPQPYQPPQPGHYPGAPTLIPPPATPAPAKKTNWLVIGLVSGAVGLVGICGIAAAAASPDTQIDRPAVAESDEPAAPVVDEPSPESEPEPEPTPEEPAEPELTVSQEQAIGSAASYLDYTGFSRTGLIGQLEYEGFSTEDAEFAVDYLDVDWNEQAVRVAESYLDYSHFSRQGLIEQLEYEGFTAEQAEHGADEVGL